MNTLEEINAKIKERGYWEIILRPIQYQEKKFTHKQLRDWLEKHQVRNRGWYYPHFSENKDFGDYYNVQGFLESYVHWGPNIENFRFYQSGQFIHYMGLQEDRLDDLPPLYAQWDPSMQNPPPKQLFLEPIMTLYQLTEIFLFTSRLSSEEVFGDKTEIFIKLHNMNHRILRTLDHRGAGFHDRECHSEIIELGPIIMTAKELESMHAKLAIDNTIEILSLFDYSSETLRDTFEKDQKNFFNKTFPH